MVEEEQSTVCARYGGSCAWWMDSDRRISLKTQKRGRGESRSQMGCTNKMSPVTVKSVYALTCRLAPRRGRGCRGPRRGAGPAAADRPPRAALAEHLGPRTRRADPRAKILPSDARTAIVPDLLP